MFGNLRKEMRQANRLAAYIMGSAKKYIDLYFDFFLFMMGLLALFSGFNRVYTYQDSTMLSLSNSELVYTQDEVREKISGTDVIALLLFERSAPVVFNGVTYEKQGMSVLLTTIDVAKEYQVKRLYDAYKSNTPSKICIYESEVE